MYDPQNPAEPSGGASKRRLLQGGTSNVWANYSRFEVSSCGMCSSPAARLACRSAWTSGACGPGRAPGHSLSPAAPAPKLLPFVCRMLSSKQSTCCQLLTLTQQRSVLAPATRTNTVRWLGASLCITPATPLAAHLQRQRLPSPTASAARPPLAAGEFWTFCPASQGSDGCEVASVTPNASPQIVPAKTCLLSYDGTKDQFAYFTMCA